MSSGVIRSVMSSVERRGPTTLRVTVDDASVALPEVVEAITESGGDVTAAREVRPSFDEVFAVLVERANEEAARVAAQKQADVKEPAA